MVITSISANASNSFNNKRWIEGNYPNYHVEYLAMHCMTTLNSKLSPAFHLNPNLSQNSYKLPSKLQQLTQKHGHWCSPLNVEPRFLDKFNIRLQQYFSV